jgi:hypothetical protein
MTAVEREIAGREADVGTDPARTLESRALAGTFIWGIPD